MKYLFWLLLFFVVLKGEVKAQNSFNLTFDNFRFKKIAEGSFVAGNLKLSDIQGSPYLDKNFFSGKIITSKGDSTGQLLLRYNAYSDDLEFKKGDEIYNVDPKSSVKKAEFGGAAYGYFPYIAGDKIRYGFFKILNEGKSTLLAKFTILFLEKEEVKAYADPKPARFDEAQKEYFISLKELPARAVTNKKGLLEIFVDKKAEMEKYISKNKLSVKEDESLIKIMEYYNSL